MAAAALRTDEAGGRICSPAMTRPAHLWSPLLLLAVLAQPAAARERAPGFFGQELSLPGIPAVMLPADLTGDGRDDLVVLVAYTGWTTRAEVEQARFDDIEGLVEVMNVVDELVDRRQLRVYPGRTEEDGFGAQLAAMDLDTTVHALATGHPGEPLVAITDDGAAAVRLVSDDAGERLRLTPLLSAVTSFAGGGRFYPELEPLHDLDGDGLPELLLPTATGWSVHQGVDTGFAPRPAAAILLPEPEAAAGRNGDSDGDSDSESESDPDSDSDSDSDGDSDSDSDSDSDRDSDSDGDSDDEGPRPPHEIHLQVEDLNGDGAAEVLVPGGHGYGGPLVYRNTGELGFAPALELRAGDDAGDEEDDSDDGDTGIMYVGDLDGDGLAVAVTRAQLERFEDPGWRQEMDEAKRPLFAYAAYGLDSALAVAAEPGLTFQAIGYTFGGTEGDDEDVEIRLPGGLQDLDGDGRQDLVAITLEFSVLPLAMKVLVIKRISLTMNFHVWCQGDDGGFRQVPGLDLSGRFKLDLDNLRVRHLSQFAGDFDGDGRADFVQLGRGRKVTIHQGRSGCRYPAAPDRSIKLGRKLRHLGLARIVDLDGDGRSDLYVVHPLQADDPEASIPARVDLYLSRF